MQPSWAAEGRIRSLDHKHGVKTSMPVIWLGTPDDTKLTLWYKPPTKPRARNPTAQSSNSAISSQEGFTKRIVYLKSSVISHFCATLKTLLCIPDEATVQPHSSQPKTAFKCTCGRVSEDGWEDVQDEDLCGWTAPCLCPDRTAGMDSAAPVEESLMQSLREVDLEVEDADHMNAAVALLHSMYTGRVSSCSEITPKIWLLMLQMAENWQYENGVAMCSKSLCKLSVHEFPTSDVYNIIQNSSEFLDQCSDVAVVAFTHLCCEFGDAQSVLNQPALLKRFLKLPYQPVLALMNRHQNTAFQPENSVEVFSKWCSAHTGQIAIKQLCTLSAADFPLNAVYSILPQIHLLPSFLTVMQAARNFLQLAYSNANKIVTTPTLMNTFLCLPVAAVLVFLKSEQLETDAELTVLLLLDAWLEHSACSPADTMDLKSAIRYSRLPKSHLSDMSLSQLRPTSLPTSQIVKIMHFLLTGFCKIESNSADWYKPSRSRPQLQGNAQANLSLKISRADLYSMLENGSIQSSPFVYAAGYLWRLILDIEQGLLGIEVKGVSSLTDLQQGVELVQKISCSLILKVSKQVAHCDPTTSVMKAFDHEFCNAGLGVHLPVVGLLSPSDPEWWEHYIVDGNVNFSALINSINS